MSMQNIEMRDSVSLAVYNIVPIHQLEWQSSAL